jgi:hypothetical protein
MRSLKHPSRKFLPPVDEFFHLSWAERGIRLPQLVSVMIGAKTKKDSHKNGAINEPWPRQIQALH